MLWPAPDATPQGIQMFTGNGLTMDYLCEENKEVFYHYAMDRYTGKQKRQFISFLTFLSHFH